MPSRLSTPSPPRRPIWMASLGLTTPSMAAAMMGIWKLRPQRSQEMSTSLGLMVIAPGASATPSKQYAAGAYPLGGGAHFGAHAIDEAVHQPRPAVHHSRLDVGDRVAPYRLLRLQQ